MVVVEVNGQNFFMDRFIKNIFDYVKPKVLHNKDFFLVLVDGRPGSGKSTGVGQFAWYLSDGNLTLDNCVFTIAELKERIENANKGDVVWLDEGFELNRRTTQSAANMEMLNILNKARAKQIFIFICLPSVYDLDKNVILGLAHLFIHFYREGDFGRRGLFKVYDRHSLKKLWLNCRADLIYSNKFAIPNFFARTTKWFPFDEKEYEKKKFESRPKDITEKESKEERNKIIVQMHLEKKTPQEISERFCLSYRQVMDIIRKAMV